MERTQALAYKAFSIDPDFVKHRNKREMVEPLKKFVEANKRTRYKVQDIAITGAVVGFCLVALPPVLLYDIIIGLPPVDKKHYRRI